MYTHKKLKHSEEIAPADGSKLKGKTKTSEGSESVAVHNNISAESMDYFSLATRKGQTTQQEYADIFEKVYNEIFVEKWNSIYQKAIGQDTCPYSEWNQYPLYIEICKHKNQGSTHSNSSCNMKCDQVFAEYLSTVSEITQPTYFERVVKFVYLYREYLNKHHLKKSNVTQYTTKMNAEDAPDVSNEFLIEFIVIDNCQMGYTKEEAISLTQNFCRWMFNESYTTSKLSIK